MKNKKLRWLLIPLVIILWALIAYQIYKGVKGEAQVIIKPKPRLVAEIDVQDTLQYVLNLDYPDPFLKNRKRQYQPSTSVGSTTPQSTAKPKVKVTVELKPLRWPDLNYKGQLEKKGDNTPMCIIEINKSLIFMRKGEDHDGIKLLKVYKDSVQVEYREREKKTLHR